MRHLRDLLITPDLVFCIVRWSAEFRFKNCRTELYTINRHISNQTKCTLIPVDIAQDNGLRTHEQFMYEIASIYCQCTLLFAFAVDSRRFHSAQTNFNVSPHYRLPLMDIDLKRLTIGHAENILFVEHNAAVVRRKKCRWKEQNCPTNKCLHYPPPPIHHPSLVRLRRTAPANKRLSCLMTTPGNARLPYLSSPIPTHCARPREPERISQISPSILVPTKIFVRPYLFLLCIYPDFPAPGQFLT